MTHESYTDISIEHILNLCRIPSPSGYTKEAMNYIFTHLQAMGFLPYLTNKGALICDLGGSGNALLLAAHVDTLGAMVRSIKSNGRLRLSWIGGFPGNFVENENVSIFTRCGKTYTGTIHLINAAVHTSRDTDTMPRNDANLEVIIDEEVKNEEDVLKLGIRNGDFVAFDARTIYTPSGFIKSRHLDDKASAGILIGLAAMIKADELKLARKTYIMFTPYEEVGHGASASIPDDVLEMISVDMGAVGDDLKTDIYKVSICAKDSGGPYNYEVVSALIKAAEDNKLNYAVDIYPFYGSDVEASLRAGYDLLHGLIGPGVFASHSYERTHRKGIENTLLLLKAYLESPAI